MIHRALTLVRKFHKLKQAETATRLGISKSYLSEIESGKKQPTLELLDRYSREFSLPPSSLLLFSEQLNGNTSTRKQKVADKVLKLLEWVAAGDDEQDAAA